MNALDESFRRGDEFRRQYEIEDALESLGLCNDDRRALIARLRLVRWTRERLRAELVSPRWPRSLDEACAAALDERGDQTVRSVLASGPSALLERTDAELFDRVHPHLHRLAREYDPTRDGGRIIDGPTGVGKSTTGVLVTRRLGRAAARRLGPVPLAEYCPAIAGQIAWARACDLPVARLSHGLGDGDPELVARAKHAVFLVLDDLGWESSRAGADDVLPEVVAHRYDHGRITLATTGLRPEQLAAKYSDAFVRRLLEAGGKAGCIVDLWPKESRQ